VPQNRLNATQYLDRRLSVAFAEDELDQVREAAQALGLSVSNFIRTSTLGTAAMPAEAQVSHLISAGAAVRTTT
jgi:hypothetical protein